jgi:branched-chain amino acid transport system substrate-binding protein
MILRARKFKLTFLALLGFSYLSFPSYIKAQVPNEILDIGVILPLSGDASYWGSNPKKGLELAVTEISKANKTKTINLHYEDDACDPKKAVSAFHKLVDIDKVKIIIGPACSSSALAIAPLAAKKDVLLLAFAEADSLSGIPNVFRLWAPNGRQAITLAKYANKFNSIATLSVENAYGNDLTRLFKKELGQEKKIVISETYQAEAAGDLKTQLLKIKSKKPDALLFVSYIKDGALLVKQAKNLGITIPLIGPSTINNNDFYSQLNSQADGIILADLPDTSTTAFRERWQKEYNEPWPGMQSGGSLFYDILKIMKSANDSGVVTTSEWKEYLFKLKDYEGESGQIEFDSKGDLKLEHVLFRVHDSKSILLVEP